MVKVGQMKSTGGSCHSRVSSRVNGQLVSIPSLSRHLLHIMASPSAKPKPTETISRRKRVLPGVNRDDSDDELGSDDLPWEWLYNVENSDRASDDTQKDRKRRKVTGNKIVGARIGTFECRIGDTVLLKAEGSNEAWVAIICEFVEDDGEGEKAANFMWFSTEKEIRNKDRKRNDFYWVYIGSPDTHHPGPSNTDSLFRRMSFTSPRPGISTH